MSAPARADAMAIARPMPLDPPLTKTRMPASEGEALLGVANFGSEVKVLGETVTRERRQQSTAQRRQVTNHLFCCAVSAYTGRMQLLVSVSDAAEARAAVDGGADIIDAKNPSMGALGAVRPDVLSEIRHAVDSSRLVTAAMGDADAANTVEELARELVARGARLVKVGFAGVADPARVEEIIDRLAYVCTSVNEASGVVAVTYADPVAAGCIDAHELLPIAARSGATGVLVDTADKRGPGLLGIVEYAHTRVVGFRGTRTRADGGGCRKAPPG